MNIKQSILLLCRKFLGWQTSILKTIVSSLVYLAIFEERPLNSQLQEGCSRKLVYTSPLSNFPPFICHTGISLMDWTTHVQCASSLPELNDIIICLFFYVVAFSFFVCLVFFPTTCVIYQKLLNNWAMHMEASLLLPVQRAYCDLTCSIHEHLGWFTTLIKDDNQHWTTSLYKLGVQEGFNSVVTLQQGDNNTSKNFYHMVMVDASYLYALFLHCRSNWKAESVNMHTYMHVEMQILWK